MESSEEDGNNENSEKEYGVESHRNKIQRTSKNRSGDDVSNVLKNLKVKNWTYLVKYRKAWYELVQKTKIQRGL